MKLKYRIGTFEDREQLQRLGLSSYGQFKNVLTEENWNKMNLFLTAESSYSDLLSKSKCFVCTTNEEIIGMAYLVPEGSPTEIFRRIGAILECLVLIQNMEEEESVKN